MTGETIRRTGTTSGLFALAVVLLAILATVAEQAYAKRGCSAFGHSCFGGHGKRYDPGLEANPRDPKDDPEQTEDTLRTRPSRQQERSSLAETPYGVSRPFEAYPLSLLLGQWVATHRRLYPSDPEANNE